MSELDLWAEEFGFISGQSLWIGYCLCSSTVVTTKGKESSSSGRGWE